MDSDLPKTELFDRATIIAVQRTAERVREYRRPADAFDEVFRANLARARWEERHNHEPAA